MSWSVSLTGNPESIVSSLEKHSEGLSGQSKTEYDAALPYLIGLVKQNYNSGSGPDLKLDAYGHGNTDSNNCSVTLKAQ